MNSSSHTAPALVRFTVTRVEDAVEVKEVFIEGCDKALDCHTVIANRPIRIRLHMLDGDASFSEYKLHFVAQHCDGGEVVGQSGQKPVDVRVTRPLEVSGNGRVLIAPLYFQTLFSQTQKKPIKVIFGLEKDGEMVSDWVSSPPFKVVSKPPTSVRGPIKKRRKSNEGESYDGENVDAPSDSNEFHSHILSELRQIKLMMTAVKPEPNTFSAGDSRPLKRKSCESELVASIAGLSHESIKDMLRELSTNHPETFATMIMTGSVMQMHGSTANIEMPPFTMDADDHFEMKY